MLNIIKGDKICLIKEETEGKIVLFIIIRIKEKRKIIKINGINFHGLFILK